MSSKEDTEKCVFGSISHAFDVKMQILPVVSTASGSGQWQRYASLPSLSVSFFVIWGTRDK